MIKILTNNVEKQLKNFWNHIVFHPTDAIEDEWGQQYLDKIAEDTIRKAGAIPAFKDYGGFPGFGGGFPGRFWALQRLQRRFFRLVRYKQQTAESAFAEEKHGGEQDG